jgi:hypothetical protein
LVFTRFYINMSVMTQSSQEDDLLTRVDGLLTKVIAGSPWILPCLLPLFASTRPAQTRTGEETNNRPNGRSFARIFPSKTVHHVSECSYMVSGFCRVSDVHPFGRKRCLTQEEPGLSTLLLPVQKYRRFSSLFPAAFLQSPDICTLRQVSRFLCYLQVIYRLVPGIPA